MDNEPKFYTIEEAMQYLGLLDKMTEKSFLYTRVTNGVIKHIKVTRGVYKFIKTDLDDYLLSLRDRIYI